MPDIQDFIKHASLPELYAALNARAQELPPDGARKLYVAGHCCGWATHAACDALRSDPQVLIDANTMHIAPALTPGEALNAVLSNVANQLREAHCLRGWRDELLDVTDGELVLGVIERAAVRALGLSTKAVHLNAWTPDGKIWVARRSLSKSTDPGMWDTLVGGLVAQGEELELALVRECGEEAGLDAPDLAQRSPLRTVMRIHRRLPEGYQVEDVLTSTCVLADNVRPANRDGEVMDIDTIDVDTAIRRIKEGEFTLEAAIVMVEDILQRQASGEI